MDQLIDDLLDFSRTSQQEMRFHTVDMEALAHQVWKDLEEFRSGREIEFVVGELPGIQGDRSMLKQVFVNLIGNAIKFTGKTNSAKIEAGGSIENGSAVYYLADNGAGFNMEYADKIFGVFQRLHSKEEFEGTGVGLALVQRIIHRHGGEIWAKGKPGLGATFYFSLPYAADAGMVEDRGPNAYTPAGSANTGSG
jgi:two-component system sensor kinase